MPGGVGRVRRAHRLDLRRRADDPIWKSASWRKGILDRGRLHHSCTDGTLIRKRLHEFKPVSSFSLTACLDGLERTHDLCVERDGACFARPSKESRHAKAAGFLVCSNTTIYKETDLNEIADLYSYLDTLGVDGYMLSPAYGYTAVQTTDIFMTRQDIREKFREAVSAPGQIQSDGFADLPRIFCEGERELECTAWGTPTFNPRGWKGPWLRHHAGQSLCVLPRNDPRPDALGKIRPRWNDPRCANCMMHVGFETTPVLGAKRQLGDTWKMLKWQFGGHMGGNPDRNASNNEHSDELGIPMEDRR